MLAPGERISGYRVRARIGQGGVAGVYEVEHDLLGSVHALKVLEIASPSARARLLQEGRLQAAVRHPNLVAVTDIVLVGDRPALVLEHVEGPTLEAWLADGPVALDDALTVFRGIVLGVQALHAAGLVHLDLHPANVLLASIDGGLVPKVADLGLARAVGQPSGAEECGPPGYTAPEQFLGAAPDPRADLFALGCLLYELVTARPAFDGPDPLAIEEAVRGGRYLPPERFVPGLPDRVRSAIRGLLTVDRARRVRTCDELLAILDGRAAPARTPTLLLPVAALPPLARARVPESQLLLASAPSPVALAAFVAWALAVIAGGVLDLWLLWPA